MDPLWLGPYVITRDLGKGIYELSNLKGHVIKNKVNVRRLKQYVKRLQAVDEPMDEPSHGQKPKLKKRKRKQSKKDRAQKQKVRKSNTCKPGLWNSCSVHG